MPTTKLAKKASPHDQAERIVHALERHADAHEHLATVAELGFARSLGFDAGADAHARNLLAGMKLPAGAIGPRR